MAASLQSRVAAQIREGIVTGDYAAGTGLSEVTLSSELGVSRTPVREALKQLATEGLVDIVPRVGTFVATPTRRDMIELYGLKEIFEGCAARLLRPAHRPRCDRRAGGRGRPTAGRSPTRSWPRPTR